MVGHALSDRRDAPYDELVSTCCTELALGVSGVPSNGTRGVVLEDANRTLAHDTALEVVRRRREVDSLMRAVVSRDHVAYGGAL